MSVAGASVSKALVAAWDDAGLDAKFKALWAGEVSADEFIVLHDQEASPQQPWPYCVLEQISASTTSRMSGGVSHLREIRDVDIRFHVHASEVSGDSRTAKEIAAYLCEEIMKVFGGHPTEAPSALTLDHGKFLIAQYQSDYGVRTGDETYEWLVHYIFRIDVPVAV